MCLVQQVIRILVQVQCYVTKYMCEFSVTFGDGLCFMDLPQLTVS